MCKRFDEGLNEEIKLLIGILEILEFAALADRAKKAEGVNNERKQAKREARVSSKRTSTKAHSFPIKKSRSRQDRSTSSVGYSGNAKSSKRHNPKSSYLSATNMGSVDDQRPKDCPERSNREVELAPKSIALNSRSRPPRPPESASDSRTVSRNSTAKSEARALARTYAIRAREEASAPDVITGIFSLYNTRVIALIDPGPTYSYIYMKLASSMNLFIELTKFVIRVSNPLGKSILVDKVCKNCPLTIQGHWFPAHLMLLPFDEFDVILGMDWLTIHDVVVNCGSKYVELTCPNGETL
ncbi:uncharacterized protein LOC108484762 [Gossypium arboreum]|uniref:uncharacterized protein LOC108484762 n=1 Tax=Gossypium arboreum TaxID=29729 RepID=UPI0008192247|nr:uncharacterized protein LOC108484762 [Gossypium arboreum]